MTKKKKKHTRVGVCKNGWNQGCIPGHLGRTTRAPDTSWKNSPLFSVFISDDYQNYPEWFSKEKRSGIKDFTNQAWCQIVVARDGFSNPMLVTKSRLFCKINRNVLRIYMTFKDEFCLNTVMGSCRGGGISPGISRVSFLTVSPHVLVWDSKRNPKI